MSAAPRILLRTPLSPWSGYGNDGIGLAKALVTDGWDVTLDPEGVQTPLPPFVAALLTKPVEPPYDVFLHHSEPMKMGIGENMQQAARRLVGWTMWEHPRFAVDDLSAMADRLANYDAVMAYDEVSSAAISEVFRGPVPTLQGGYSAEEWTPREGDPARSWDGPIRFGMVGNLSERKNPFATVRAFEKLREEFGEKVELHLKSNVALLHPAMQERYPGLNIYEGFWSADRLRHFYLSINCLVAPSTGEGKNLPALEAQTTGCPVIVSDVGGHRQWADRDWSFSVSGGMAPNDKGLDSFAVDEERLLMAMRLVVERPTYAERKGQLAARVIPQSSDWSKVVFRLRETLKTIPERSLTSL